MEEDESSETNFNKTLNILIKDMKEKHESLNEAVKKDEIGLNLL